MRAATIEDSGIGRRRRDQSQLAGYLPNATKMSPGTFAPTLHGQCAQERWVCVLEGNVLRTQPCSIVTNHRVSRRMRGSRYQMDTSTDSETTSTSEDDARCLRPRMRNVHDDDEDYSTSSDGCESEHRPPPRKTRGKKSRKR